MWNLVGFQTRLRIPEQQRVFRHDPGLEHAEFLRFGCIHRNSYLNARPALGPALAARDDDRLFFAGQLTGVEGYTESLGDRAARRHQPRAHPRRAKPPSSRRRRRCSAASTATCARRIPKHFQPMNANFGLLEPLPGKVKKDRKKELLVERALAEFGRFLEELR